MSSFPFLRLPLELRRHVYASIADDVPRVTPMADFAGLSLSCHQVKSEFEEEYMRVYKHEMRNFAESLPREIMELSTIPTTFANHSTLSPAS